MIDSKIRKYIDDMVKKDYAYLPIKMAINNGLDLLYQYKELYIFKEIKRKALYIIGTLNDYQESNYKLSFDDIDVVYLYDLDLAKSFNCGHIVDGFYVFYNDDHHLIDIDDGDFRVLDESYFKVVRENYPYISDEEIFDDLKNKRLFGSFVNDVLVGFIGIHEDGTMGMLRIFEQYKRCGYGFKLEAMLNNYLIKNNKEVYCHVELSNEASIKLQEKLGYKQSIEHQIWIFNE